MPQPARSPLAVAASRADRSPSPLLRAALAAASALALLSPAHAQLFAEPRRLSTDITDVSTAYPVDIDTDGDIDVIACGRPVPGFTVFLNDGTGAFSTTRVVAPDLRRPAGVGAGDMDGDGDVDLLVAGGRGLLTAPRGLWYVEANAPGEFLAPVLLLDNPFIGGRIEVVDLDGDGDLDATVAGRYPFSSSEAIVENFGGGALLARLRLGSADHLRTLDVDGDGRLDLVRCDAGGLDWARSRAPFVYETPRAVGGAASGDRIELGDLDGDGLQEVVTAPTFPTAIMVVPNLGGGDFANRISLSVAGPEPAPREHVLVDVDLDGDLDIVHAPREGAGPRWLCSDGSLGFAADAAFASGATTACEDLRVADLDGDGVRDLVIAGNGSDVLWIRGDPQAATDAKFEPSARSISAAIDATEDVVALDIDLDGDEDVIAASSAGGVAIARGDGVGGQRPWTSALVTLGGVRAMAVGDLDGDGGDDLALRTAAGEVVVALAAPGGLGAPVVVDALGSGADVGVWLADADADGDLDLFANEGTELYLYRRDAPASFAARVLMQGFPYETDGVAACDFDRDGMQDLVLAVRHVTLAEDRIVWLRGGGAGGLAGYGAPESIHQGARNRGVPQIQDGATSPLPQLNVVDRASGDLLLYWVSPSGSVAPPFVRRFDVGQVEELFVTPPNQGSLVDFFYVRRVAGALEVIWDPEGSLSAPELVVASGLEGPLVTLVRDLDGDGDRDVVYARRGGAEVLLAENLSRTPVGVEFCAPAAVNSTGAAARIVGLGAALTSGTPLALRASELPPGATTLFLVSTTQGFVPNAAGSDGDLCLAGTIGRFVAPGEVGPASQDGVRTLRPELGAIPAGATTFAVGAFDRLLFQTWYRDGATSNFTPGLAVQF